MFSMKPRDDVCYIAGSQNTMENRKLIKITIFIIAQNPLAVAFGANRTLNGTTDIDHVVDFFRVIHGVPKPGLNNDTIAESPRL